MREIREIEKLIIRGSILYGRVVWTQKCGYNDLIIIIIIRELMGI